MEGVVAADMGELKSSDLTDVIVAALERTDVGGLSDPFDRPDGATSIMVCSRKTTGSDIPTRDQIEDRLMDQQLGQASKRALRDLRRQATLVVR
jgi:peptidyl-prolyl cis-trans isomerase SurA